MFNPANTGLHYKHYGNAVYRSQWDGVENAPNSFTGIYEAKLESINSGVGIGYLHDVIGLGSSKRIYLNYAYHLQLDNSLLSIGGAAVFNRLGFKEGWVTPDGGAVFDPNLPVGAYDIKLNVNFGITYKRDKLEIGVSSTQINEPFYNDVNFQSTRYYMGMVAYQFELSKNIDLKPRFYIKSDGVASIMEVNTLFTLKNKYWMGLTYRHSDGIGIQAGIDFKEKFRIGYSYDFMTNKIIGQYGSGSHEIVFAILIK